MSTHMRDIASLADGIPLEAQSLSIFWDSLCLFNSAQAYAFP